MRTPPPSSLALAALALIALYLGLDVALVFLRPGLSVLHNAESDYGSAGPYGWVMNVNFLVRCLLSLAVVAALAGGRAGPLTGRLRRGLVLLAVWALASGLLGLFPDDPVGSAHTTGSGRVHVVLAVVAFAAVLVGSLATTRALRADPRFAPITPALTVLAFAALAALLLLGRAGLHRHSLGGLFEKVFLGLELAWLALVALRLASPRVTAAAPLPAAPA